MARPPRPIRDFLLAAGLLATAGAMPAAADSGGLQYQDQSARPVATSFTVAPNSIVAGANPNISLRVDQSGSSYVTARIVFVPQRSGAVLRVRVGRVATGRTVPVRMPRRARLVPGRYRVRLHVRGAGGTTLLRDQASPGTASLTVLTTDTQALDPVPAAATFPVAGTHTYGEPFGVPRADHIHEGQDVAASQGTPVVAPLAGSVAMVGYQAKAAGEYIVEHTTAGYDFFFAHCRRGSTVVAAGDTVASGAQLCAVGETGDASGPHLHFEVWVNGWRDGPSSRPIDPVPLLRGWDDA